MIKPILMRDIMTDPVVSNYLNNIPSPSHENIQAYPHSIVTPAIRKAVRARLEKNTTKQSPTSVIVFDTETTWVDKSARIVQIACALYEKNEENSFGDCRAWGRNHPFAGRILSHLL